jgi:hypothetical protein
MLYCSSTNSINHGQHKTRGSAPAQAPSVIEQQPAPLQQAPACSTRHLVHSQSPHPHTTSFTAIAISHSHHKLLPPPPAAPGLRP